MATTIFREMWLPKNETCESSIDLQRFLHYSLVPSVAIIIVLSCLEKRSRERPIDEKWPFLRRRCGILIPLDFVEAFANRWSLAFAFGATASKVMILFSGGCLPLQVPRWAQVPVILVCSMEVGLSSYPFFICLSTLSQITGALLGFLYTGSWFIVIVLNIAQCPHGQVVGKYEKILFYWPSLLCLVFLLSRFSHILMKTLWVRLRQDLPSEETSFLKIHQAQYVQQLMRKPPRLPLQKSWIQRKVYEWDPDFRFPSRMICMAVLALICLYLFVMIEVYVGKLVLLTLNILEENFETLIAAQNTSEVLASSVQRLKEFIDVTEGYLIVHIVQCLFGVMLMYILVLPIKHGQAIEAVKSLGPGILTVAIVVGLMVLQTVTATRFFLQPKISPDDKEKPLALDNRKAFHNFNYFFFFYNVLLGLSACLYRLLCSVVVGAWLIARIDRTIMPKGYEAADMGFRTWIGMLLMDHYHTNPTLVCFCHILVVQLRIQLQPRTTSYHCFSNGSDFRVSKKARTRWLLLYTLLNNPSLSALRKPK
ncbi:stimulated by retinoic acid gene 6 protein-like isoform X4 [Eublepharis macularius]|uniref:Stimulated by retinoic acid gene 6 protein-like isoform X4 n=1 Tax=Eublepharis macularius TaxID=481883 RepID=A0AA97JNR9_EUBMA|nr:stimulated by retinoic acid gene 6 protein-like isoform X4 [Eublepharis macularius]